MVVGDPPWTNWETELVHDSVFSLCPAGGNVLLLCHHHHCTTATTIVTIAYQLGNGRMLRAVGQASLPGVSCCLYTCAYQLGGRHVHRGSRPGSWQGGQACCLWGWQQQWWQRRRRLQQEQVGRQGEVDRQAFCFAKAKLSIEQKKVWCFVLFNKIQSPNWVMNQTTN